MADNNGPKITYGSVGTTAETSYLTDKVKQVAIHNTSSSLSLYARVFTSANSATGAQTQADATDAVALADDNFLIPPNSRRVVYKSAKPQWVAVSIIASGAGPTAYENCGTVWYD